MSVNESVGRKPEKDKTPARKSDSYIYDYHFFIFLLNTFSIFTQYI